MNNGNPNNNNKSNSNRVVPFYEIEQDLAMFVTDEEIYEAYLDCRKHKQGTIAAMQFESNLEENLCNLADELNNRTYRISASIAFCVTRPKLREVFAASFRDRIVHHLVAIRLNPIIEAEMIDETYNCRKEKGSLKAIEELREHIRLISENYTKECYVLTCDIKGFFMHIDKELLWRRLEELIDAKYKGKDKDGLKWIVRMIVMNRPEANCIKVGNVELFDQLDPDKSKFKNGGMKGVEIGNLPSQIFANFFLTPFDHFIKTEVMWYERYADDFALVDTDKEKLLSLIPVMRRKLMKEFGLELHPNKIYFQSYTKGVKFVGCVVKYGRIMAGNRMVGNLVSLVRRMKDCEDKEGECERYAARLNSYFNFIRHGTEHATLSRINREIQADWSKYLYMGRNYVIKVKKKYKTKHKIIETVKKNRYEDKSNPKKRRVRRARYKRKRRNRDVQPTGNV